MRKAIYLLATAMVAQSFVFTAAPAAAATIQDQAYAVCFANRPNSTWTTSVNGLVTTSTTGVELSRVTVANILGGTELSRTPETFSAASEHRNGSSPNIFGDWETVVTYSGGFLDQLVTVGTASTTTFGCRMTNNGSNFPGPQQIPVGSLQFSSSETTGTFHDIVSAPNYTETLYVEKVICNSPSTSSKKTAANGWANQNGYGGTCSTAVYLTLGGGTHSNSVPGLTPLRPNAPDATFVSDPDVDTYALPPYEEEA